MSLPSITLYRANGACSFVPHAVLKELAIPFQDVVMKWGANGLEAADGSVTSEEYRKIHHFGYVPALRVNDTIITEMPAILTYISSLAPDRKLIGQNDLERAKAAEWMAFLSGSLHGMGYGRVFRPGRFSDDEAQFPTIKQQGKQFVADCYKRIDGLLQGKSFAVGEQDTVVDFNLVIFWYWGLGNGFSMREDYPNYGELVRRMETKESVREVAKLEGKKLSFESQL